MDYVFELGASTDGSKFIASFQKCQDHYNWWKAPNKTYYRVIIVDHAIQ